MEKTNERDFDAETGSDETAPDSALREADCQLPIPEAPASTIQDKEAAGQPTSLVKKRRPGEVELLGHQLNLVARDGRVCGAENRANLRKGTLSLYSSLSSKDPIDSMLARVMVAITNLTMECIARAESSSAPSQEINLRYSIKGAVTLAQLTEAYDSRRGRGRRHVTVGAVNVEQGGQAIVGNIEPQRLEPSPPPGSSTDESKK